MSKALKPLKDRERTTVDNLVHCFVMADLARNVPDMEGVFDYFMKHSATADQRRQWKAFQARVQEVRGDMASLLEKDSMPACDRAGVAAFCSGEDVRRVRLKSQHAGNGRTNEFKGKVVWMCKECRKANNGGFKIEREAKISG